MNLVLGLYTSLFKILRIMDITVNLPWICGVAFLEDGSAYIMGNLRRQSDVLQIYCRDHERKEEERILVVTFVFLFSKFLLLL